MVKRYTLQQLLKHAANKEDIDRQAHNMEQKLAPVPDQVNRIHPKKTRKSKDKRKPKPPHDDKKENPCQFCGTYHKGSRSNCPASGKTCGLYHFARMRKGKKKTTENSLSKSRSKRNSQPTNHLVAPKPHKPHAIRFCCSLRVPNSVILRPVTETLTVEEVRFKLEGATVFSVLDMNDRYQGRIQDFC